jgi:hypothetical protein
MVSRSEQAAKAIRSGKTRANNVFIREQPAMYYDGKTDPMLFEIYSNISVISPWKRSKAPMMAIEINEAIRAYSIEVAPF